jgi:uncharacterized protein (UPF0332 family)
MSLAMDLLKQSRLLANHESKRPRQASLRRAVSSAYYALFHQLVDAASRKLVTAKSGLVIRQRVARVFGHAEMKKFCQTLANWDQNQPPKHLKELLQLPPSQDLRTLANAFVELQQARHEADYDISRRFSRDDVLALIRTTELAVAAFERMDRKGEERQLLLLGLAFNDRWQRN